MVTQQQRPAIKEIAGRLAWNDVWRYQDDGNPINVFVIETGLGWTVSQWHLSELSEGIEEILGPEQAFIIQGLEETTPETWFVMQAL